MWLAIGWARASGDENNIGPSACAPVAPLQEIQLNQVEGWHKTESTTIIFQSNKGRPRRTRQHYPIDLSFKEIQQTSSSLLQYEGAWGLLISIHQSTIIAALPEHGG